MFTRRRSDAPGTGHPIPKRNETLRYQTPVVTTGPVMPISTQPVASQVSTFSSQSIALSDGLFRSILPEHALTPEKLAAAHSGSKDSVFFQSDKVASVSEPVSSNSRASASVVASEATQVQSLAVTTGSVTTMTLAATATAVVIVPLGTTAAQLQSLINAAPAGTTLQLQAGHYSFDQTIVIDRDDISVIGAGSDKTFIDVPPALGEEAFQVGSGSTKGAFTLAADMAEGSTVMTLTGSHSFAVGDYVYLSRESTTEFYDAIGDTEWRNTDVPLRTSIVQVVAVDGAKITLSSGVHFDFTKGETTVTEIGMAENVTLGGFTVDYGLPEADPSNFSNTKSNYDRNAVIEVDGTAGLHLYDITSHDVPSLGVNVASSTHVTADSLTMTGSHNKGDGGNGYGLQIRDVYDSSFTNIVDADMRHSVVFASWTSAAGNFVHVAQTDRDINFHGGRDHDNVVVVDSSIRDANSDIIGPTLFVNTESTHYGSVTDADANTVTFGTVVGSRLADALTGYANGASLSGMGGNDTLTGGAGNDLLIGGSGKDVLNGAGGEDIVQYSGSYSNFTITDKGNGVFEVRDRTGNQSTDLVSQVEWLVFDDKAVHLTDMSVSAASAVSGIFDGAGTWTATPPTTTPVPVPVPVPVIVELVGTSGKDVFEVTNSYTTVKGLQDFDTVHSTVSFTLGNDVERLDLVGTAAINGTGNVNGEHLHGNDANNTLQGMAGADRLWGQLGNDVLLGGADNDLLYGDGGNDRLDGGAGQDKLTGGSGADVFVFSFASDSERVKSDKITDFQTGSDKIDLSAIDADTAIAGNQAFVFGTSADGAASLWMKSGYIYGDVNNDGVADLAIYVTGTVVLADVLL